MDITHITSLLGGIALIYYAKIIFIMWKSLKTAEIKGLIYSLKKMAYNTESSVNVTHLILETKLFKKRLLEKLIMDAM